MSAKTVSLMPLISDKVAGTVRLEPRSFQLTKNSFVNHSQNVTLPSLQSSAFKDRIRVDDFARATTSYPKRRLADWIFQIFTFGTFCIQCSFISLSRQVASLSRGRVWLSTSCKLNINCENLRSHMTSGDQIRTLPTYRVIIPSSWC